MGRWTKEEQNLLINNCKGKTYKELSLLIGRSVNGIKKQARNLNLTRYIVREGSWSEQDIKFLINNREFMTSKELGEKIGRSEDAVRKMASTLNI